MNEQKYMEERLNYEIEWYDKKSQNSQRWYKSLKKAEIFLSALIPVTIALWADYFITKVFIASAGATIAIINSIHGLNKYHENWIEYRSVCETLRHEKFLYETRSGIYGGVDNPFNLLVERIESIISHENINWTQINKCNIKNGKNTIKT